MRFGTRRSPLAQAQADLVLRLHPGKKVLIQSEGDQDLVSSLHHMEAPGAFTRTLTAAILDGRIDAAVHSLKDLPLDSPETAPVVAILARHDPADVVLVRDDAHDPQAFLHLKPGSRIGTSAPRRQAQARDADPLLVCVDVRGNVHTRIGLLEAGVVDGLLMAAAVFERIDLLLPSGITMHRLDPARFPGSPGQGAVAVQSHADHAGMLGRLDHAPTRLAVEAERAVLRALGGGCGLPLGCLVAKAADAWHLWATLAHPTGQTRIHVQGEDPAMLAGPAVRALQVPPAPTPTATPADLVVAMTLGEQRLPDYQAAMPGLRIRSWPLIQTQDTGTPMPEAATSCRWMAVTSQRAADAATRAFGCLPAPPRVAAVGTATADALRRRGLPVHVVAPDGTGTGLADAVAAFPTDQAPVLVPQAEEASGGLKEGLTAHGFQVVAWPVYRTVAHPSPRPACDVVVLCSASAARAYAAAAYPPGPSLVALGPTTATAMQEAGLPVDARCPVRGPDGVRQALASMGGMS